MRVLVIEDDTTLGHALREFLVEQGYAVDWLTDGEQALGAIAGQGYDLLLLDLNLPGQSGLDILRKLRAGNEQVPVLILTARDGVEDRVAGLDAGARSEERRVGKGCVSSCRCRRARDQTKK